jgi:ATP-binding cassette, subfamily F, member 3
VLLISHDRALLDAVGSRTIAVEDRSLRSYVGGWPEYLRVREERAQDERTAKRAKPPKARPQPARRAAAGPSKNQRRQAERLEKEIERAEAALQALEEELADPAAWSSPDRSAKSTRRHERAKAEVERLYAQLEAVAG